MKTTLPQRYSKISTIEHHILGNWVLFNQGFDALELTQQRGVLGSQRIIRGDIVPIFAGFRISKRNILKAKGTLNTILDNQ